MCGFLGDDVEGLVFFNWVSFGLFVKKFSVVVLLGLGVYFFVVGVFGNGVRVSDLYRGDVYF